MRSRPRLGADRTGQILTAELQDALLAHLAALFSPLTTIRDAEQLGRVLDLAGWDLDALTGVDVSAVVSAAQSAAQAVEELVEVVQHGTGELEEYAGAAAAFAVAAVQIVDAVGDWSPPVGLTAEDLALLPVDLLAVLLDGYLRSAAPRVAAVFDLIGVLHRVPAPALARSDGTVVRRAMDRPEVDLTVLQRAVTDPLGLLADRFLRDETGTRLLAEGIADAAGPLLAQALTAMGLQAGYGVPGRGAGLRLTADELAAARHMLQARYALDMGDGLATASFVLAAGLTDDTAGRGLGLVLAPSGELAVSAGPVEVTLAGDPGALLITGSGVDFDPAADAELTLTVRYVAPGDPAVRFGSATGTRFELGAISVSLTGQLTPTALDFGVTLTLQRVLLAVAAGDGDGFLSKVLPAEPIEARADLLVDWSLRTGLTVRGSGSLEIHVAVGLMLGPITIDEVSLGVALGEAGIGAQVGIGATLAIGPLVASVQGVGLRAMLAPPSGPGAGGSMMAIGFKPPTGIGFAVDAGPVKGGGLVSIDEPAHQYVGILQLDLAGIITITAIGLLTTRMPDGSDGFSLLVIITVEFPPIQLGYGFALIGLGGLLGVNRTFVVEALQAGVRTGALGSILFPKNPVANATQLIATLKTVFPPAAGHFVFGPMIKLGWGPNQIIAFELGLLVELPSPLRLVIIGKIMVVLPDKDAAVVQLRLDVLGVLDFARGEVSIDASLVDSRIAAFAVAGDMALRVGWKSTPGFALAVGGFHPKFTPPPGFPSLRRLSISLATGENPLLRLETYFAITANSIQFGGRLDLAVTAGPFAARAYAGLDALVELVPLRLQVTLSMGIDITWNGTPFLHAQLEAALTGPTPWRAVGFVEFQVLLVTARISVDVTTGTGGPADVLRVLLADLLRAALESDDAWTAQLPAGGGTGVSIGGAAALPGELVVNPVGGFTVRQRAMPLEAAITRFGAARPEPNTPDRFALTDITVGGVTVGGVAVPGTPVAVRDQFAAGQYADLTDDEKLTRPAFEELPSGATAGMPRYRLPGVAVTADLDYDEAVVNAEEPRPPARLDPALGAALARDGLAGHSAAAASALATPVLRVELVPERWVPCSLDSLSPRGAPASYLQAAADLRPGEQLVTAGEVA